MEGWKEGAGKGKGKDMDVYKRIMRNFIKKCIKMRVKVIIYNNVEAK